MGHWVTASLLASVASLTGCSLIYNPSNLPPQPGDGPPPDMPVDMFMVIDANPLALEIDPITQAPALEGQGVGGAAPALLFLRGTDIAPGATVTIAPEPANPDVTITVGTPEIATNGKSLAVPVTVELSALGQGPVALKVTVAQPPPNEAVTKTVDWTVTMLDTYDLTGTQQSPDDGKLFSHATIAASLIFAKGNTNTRRAIIRTVSSIVVTSGVTIDANANANGVVPGAGGCAGGPAGTAGSCFGKGAGSTAGGGGGGGFSAAGGAGEGGGAAGVISGSKEVADHSVIDVPLENRGGGGGGGAGGVGGGGPGGGGGGVIELTAGGDLTLTGVTLTANGAAGANGGGVAGASGGGGGAGGLVMLRSGGTLSPPTTITVSGGGGGAPGGLGGGKSGGPGAAGRIRVDAPATVAGLPAGTYTGPMIVRPASQIVRGTGSVTLAVRANMNDRFTLLTLHDDGSNNTQTIDPFNGGMLQPVLEVGLNRVCVVLTNGAVAQPEGANCVELAYVP